MKKIPVVLIVLWSVLFVLGVLSFVIGALVSMPLWLRLCIALCLWLGDGLWILVALLKNRKRKSKPSNVFAGNQAVFQRISKETNEAVSRYLGAVLRKGIMKKSALYERPWFLLCGAPKSGKTSLLRGAGLNFPLRYPSEKDGVQIEGADQITWYFANEAVWIDVPGSLMEDEKRDVWQAFLASLREVRPERPVDGMAMVVNAHEVHRADDRAVKDGAKMLRNRIDDLIAAWGIEFPVSLLFNQSDKIPGFAEYFGDQFVKSQDQIFGATIVDQEKMLPRMVFAQEFGLLSKSLTDLRLDKLFKEKDPARRRMICRFVIHFEAMQEKLGAFVTEMFKPSNYEGKPLFRGFYFTSCIEIAPRDDTAAQSRSADVGHTIANHPLNPHKMLARQDEAQKTGAAHVPAGGKHEVTSLFVLPLFREIMVRDKSLVKTTQKRSRRETVRHYLLTAAVLAAAAGAAGFLYAGLSGSLGLFAEIKSLISGVPSDQGSLPDQYAGLDAIGKAVSRLQHYDDHGAPPAVGLSGYYRGHEALAELQKQYFTKIQSLVVGPSVKYLEYVIWEKAQAYGDLAGEDYDNLYNYLKAYLSVSEAVSDHPKDIDTAFLRPVLLDAIKQSLLSAMGNDSRLPQQLETILQENVGVYLLYLKRRQLPAVQENQKLVMAARSKLRRLPSAENLYQSVVNRLSQDAPSISLDQMLNRQQEGILKSERKISVLYTQDGWDKYVSEGISQASKDPFRLDWVIGLSSNDVPEVSLDKKKLYADMAAAYLADFKQQWLGFIASVKMEPFGDLERSQRILQKLVADGSELAVLLQTVSTYTVLKQESMADKAGGALLEAASKSKAGKGLASSMAKADSAADKAAGAFSLGRKSPADDMNATFDPLRTFTRSTGGALSGYEGYKDKIMTLSGKLAALATQSEDYALVVFSGRDDDALLNAWKYTQSALTAMPEELAGSLKGVLLLPLSHTGAAASAVLTKTLNARWHSEIVKPFTSRFSGRYPFTGRGEDASFTDVMDFFRPQTGTFWGFYDRVLSPFIVKNSSGWMVRPVGSLSINFNPAGAKALTNGERIRDIFFKPDGTLRVLATTITPAGSNKNSARIEVNGQISDLTPGGKSVNVNWPIDATPLGASLKINVSGDFTQDISFSGAWGFLKLLQAARVNKVSGSVINAKWQVNVQNMYMIYQDYRIQVAGSDHPFGDPVFSGFDCPTDLCIAPDKK